MHFSLSPQTKQFFFNGAFWTVLSNFCVQKHVLTSNPLSSFVFKKTLNLVYFSLEILKHYFSLEFVLNFQ